jgi:hypothetical protein
MNFKEKQIMPKRNIWRTNVTGLWNFREQGVMMYMRTKELGWKETQRIQNIGIKDSQENRIVEQSQVLKIWENYITELYDRPDQPETLEVEREEEVDTDEKGPYILQSEVEKAIKEMRNKKATGDDDVPEDVLKLLGEGG